MFIGVHASAYTGRIQTGWPSWTVVWRPLQWPHLIRSTMFALRPSGAGKTVIATRLIERILKGDDQAEPDSEAAKPALSQISYTPMHALLGGHACAR